MIKPGVQVLKDYLVTEVSLAFVFVIMGLIFSLPSSIATLVFPPHSINAVFNYIYYDGFPLRILLFFLVLMPFSHGIVLPFRWRKLRQEQREFTQLLEHPETISDEYSVEVESPLVLPLTATQPFTRQEIISFGLFCLGGPLLLRFTIWARPYPQDLASAANINIVSDVLALVFFAWLCWLALSSRKWYTADSQGIEIYLRGRFRRENIQWRDVVAIMYAPIAFSQNTLRRAEQYVIITSKKSITLDVPMQNKAEPSNETERRLQEYQHALRAIAVIASKETGIPIRIAKKLAEQRARMDMPFAERMTQQQEKHKTAIAALYIIGVAAGLTSVAFGGYFLAIDHVSHFHPVSGVVERFTREPQPIIRLVGDATNYTFFTDTDGDIAYHPQLPQTIPAGTEITIWLNGAYLYADAIQIDSINNHATITYANDFYNNPVIHYRNDIIGFSVIIAVGVFLIGFSTRQMIMLQRHKRKSQVDAPLEAGA